MVADVVEQLGKAGVEHVEVFAGQEVLGEVRLGLVGIGINHVGVDLPEAEVGIELIDSVAAAVEARRPVVEEADAAEVVVGLVFGDAHGHGNVAQLVGIDQASQGHQMAGGQEGAPGHVDDQGTGQLRQPEGVVGRGEGGHEVQVLGRVGRSQVEQVGLRHGRSRRRGKGAGRTRR